MGYEEFLMRRLFRHLKIHSAGFSLIEVMIASGLLSFGLLTVSVAIEYMNRYDRQLEFLDSRDELLNLLKRYGSNVRSLAASANFTENTDLKRCLDGIVCNSQEPLPFTLYMPNSTGPEGRISGTPTSPVRYTIRGLPCAVTASVQQCPLEVFTEFRPQCKPDTAATLYPQEVCASVPDFIEIFYTIQQSPNYKSGSKGSIALKKVEGLIIVEF